MTEKERKYRAAFRNIGKHLFRDDDGFPVSLKTHPQVFLVNCEERLVDWGWGIKRNGHVSIPYNRVTGEPEPYDGFWEARCHGRVI